MTNDKQDQCVSYVVTTMDSELNLTIHTKRGRPTKKESMKSSRQLKSDLRQLRKQMNYKDGTEIVLAISVATDEMARRVHMFPEVMYLDVTANTNKQNRDLFMMVVKDSDGSTHIGNTTFIPSGKSWVFSLIYQTFFVTLYGKNTISRVRLCLTDDDTSEWRPLDSCMQTISCWSGARHMLCMFHAVTLAFFEQIHPKLPHKSGKVTSLGKKYGETALLFFIWQR